MAWKPFNELNPAQTELLALLAEEMGEAIQAIGKVLRHGYDSYHPVTDVGNRESLEHELGDVRCAMIMLCESGAVSRGKIHRRAEEKAAKVQQYLHEQFTTATEENGRQGDV
jgi:NTP pyrophosphatase (non-canonical NTP hydrolase)